MGISSSDAVSLIRKKLAALEPMISGHGGAIEFIRYEDNIVYVKLHGACQHCPVSMFTLKLGIEEGLQEVLPDLKEVVAIEE
jgi:Fe-S cluster biogenesis protein NfuA